MRIIKNLSRILFASCSLAMALTGSATEINFTYNSDNHAPEGYGFKKEQVYDVGIALNSPLVVGREITSINVPILSAEYVSDVKVWLSSQLNASKGTMSVFTPDIVSYDASVEDGVLSFTFPQPYLIPEEGVYIGYSFSVVDLPVDKTAEPIATVGGSAEGGLWLHAGVSQKKWADMAKRNNMVSAMVVSLRGDFPQNAAQISIGFEEFFMARNETSQTPVKIVNLGTSGISSFNYVYSINGTQTEGTCMLDPAVPPVLGSAVTTGIDIVPQDKDGQYVLEFMITKVNGAANEIDALPVSVPVTVQAFVPQYRPLVEEFTGLNCSWCPKGYVMMEQMKLKHGDMFVGMAYHSPAFEHNAMDCIKAEDFPVRLSGYPSATFNRGGTVNPEDIPAMWERIKGNNTSAEITVDYEWADDVHTRLTATAKVRFVNEVPEADYCLSFALVADGLSNDKWLQSNAYSEYELSEEFAGPYWDLFVGQPSPVAGLVFNDVVVYYPDIKGIEGSLPESLEAETWYDYTFEINTEDVVNLESEHIVKDFNKTRVVAILMKGKGGKPINCISSVYPDGNVPDAIEAVEDEKEVISTEYYDFSGNRVFNPVKGLYIRRDRLSDGSIRTYKTAK